MIQKYKKTVALFMLLSVLLSLTAIGTMSLADNSDDGVPEEQSSGLPSSFAELSELTTISQFKQLFPELVENKSISDETPLLYGKGIEIFGVPTTSLTINFRADGTLYFLHFETFYGSGIKESVDGLLDELIIKWGCPSYSYQKAYTAYGYDIPGSDKYIWQGGTSDSKIICIRDDKKVLTTFNFNNPSWS